MNVRWIATRAAGFVFLVLVAPPLTWAATNTVNFDFFYGAMPDSGSWRESAVLGFVWQPKIATGSPDWRPYTDGYWSQTDQGWTWISNEDFGWATYHYGRWAKIPDNGWVWVPGFEWAPAWVSWRATPRFTGRSGPPARRAATSTIELDAEEVIGWAPLPPDAVFNFARGFTPQVDADFALGPGLYNFVLARYFGEVPLLPWIFRPSDNEAFLTTTWNCTNTAYNRSQGFIWCGGPDYAALRPAIQQSVPRLRLVAESVGPIPPPGGYANRVQNYDLFVVAPRITHPPVGAIGSVGIFPGRGVIAPPGLGPALDAKPPDRGWSTAQTNGPLREQIKLQAAASPKLAVAPSIKVPPAHVIAISEPVPAKPPRQRWPAPRAAEDRAKPAASPAGERPPRKKGPIQDG